MSYVRVDLDDGLAELTLSRPEKRNALNRRMLLELRANVEELRVQGGVRALVVASDGPVFCAGADLVEFSELSDARSRSDWEALGLAAFAVLADFPAPVIAAVQGGAFGGGVELALHCDIRIVGTECVLAMPEVSLGWKPEWGALERLPTLVGASRALYLTLTGSPVSSKQAVDWGLASEACDQPLVRARVLAHAFSEAPIAVVRDVLAALRIPVTPTRQPPPKDPISGAVA